MHNFFYIASGYRPRNDLLHQNNRTTSLRAQRSNPEIV